MSGDFEIYVRQVLTEGELAAHFEGLKDFAVEPVTDGLFTVVRGARRKFAFQVEGPHHVELEDVPPEVTESVLAARTLIRLSVPSASLDQAPHAERCARALARRFEGVVFDPQSGQVWGRSTSRIVPRPERHTRVSLVELRWCCLYEGLAAEPASLFLDVCRRFLPEALPRRFGEWEPLQGNLARDGDDGFVRAWRDSGGLMFAGSGLCSDGYLGEIPQDPSGYAWSMSVDLFAEPLHQPAWRDAAQRFFVELADALPAFYASATVSEGWIWTGRSLSGYASTQVPLNTCVQGEWIGLSPDPVWWAWFGGPYRPQADLLPAEGRTPTERGAFFETSTTPLPRRETTLLTTWLSPDLFATIGPSPDRHDPPQLAPAADMPASLRG